MVIRTIQTLDGGEIVKNFKVENNRQSRNIMALRDQPYIPLYVQDYLTDEKLNMCSASTQGIYIKIMCILHKSEQYGTILLKQKDKQNSSSILNFAYKFAKLLPFDLLEIQSAITELLDENVMSIDGNSIFQKRMVEDNRLSEIRALAGRKGGKKTQNKTKKFAKAKSEANTENENENENEDDNEIKSKINKEKKLENDFEEFRIAYPGVKRGLKTEYDNFKKKHDDWKLIIPILKTALQVQYFAREQNKQNGNFVPEWKNLQTYINQRAWEEEITIQNLKTDTNGKQSVSDKKRAADSIIDAMYSNQG